MIFDLKEVNCTCGEYFTAPKTHNSITNEFTRIPYKEGIVKENGKYIILYCPTCNKEIIRVDR